MPPRKRKVAAEEKEPAPAPAPAGRVTRSSVRRASEPNLDVAGVVKSPAKKTKPKADTTRKKVEAENGNGAPDILGDKVEKKNQKKTNAKTKTTTIVIEHCTQCRSFKRRAEEAKAGLESSVSGISVLFNPEKPRRGCFEIRAEGGEKFITLLDLKRPFKRMKDLDMEEVVKDITSKIK